MTPSLQPSASCYDVSYRRISSLTSCIFLLIAFLSSSSSHVAAAASEAKHNNNWAVLVSTSRYWFNYRHTSNALALYHTIKSMGIPDSQILLMLPDEYACNPRNVFPGEMFTTEEPQQYQRNLYARDIEVDYRGTEVKVESFLRLLTGRHDDTGTPRSKRLLTNSQSNIFIYMSGHGGNNFLKFQDHEELNAQDLHDAIQQMNIQRRYNSILFMLDTCQAETLFWELDSNDTPDVITIGSSKIKQNSYSAANDYRIGTALADRFTYRTLEFFEKHSVIQNHNQRRELQKPMGLSTRKTVKDLFESYTFDNLRSEVSYRSDLISRLPNPRRGGSPLVQFPLTDYFGAVTPLHRSQKAYDVERNREMETMTMTKKSVVAASSSAKQSTTPSSSSSPFAFTSTPLSFVLLGAGVLVLLLSIFEKRSST